jgi:hypothetical protein
MVMLDVIDRWWARAPRKSGPKPVRGTSVIRRVKFFGILTWELFCVEHDYIADCEEDLRPYWLWVETILPRLKERLKKRMQEEGDEDE